MERSHNERFAVFIDSSSLWATAKSLGIELDFRKLLGHFRQNGRLVRAIYYTTIAGNQKVNSIQRLLDWLEYNEYTVVAKPVNAIRDADGELRQKRSLNIEIAVDVLRLAPSLDHVYLFTGNGDFRELVGAVQDQGKRVSIVSTLATDPPMCADELRRQADQFIDLTKIEHAISRD